MDAGRDSILDVQPAERYDVLGDTFDAYDVLDFREVLDVDDAGDVPLRPEAGDTSLASDASNADVADASSDSEAPSCLSLDLKQTGSGDFNISFHVVTKQTGLVALLNQRSFCSRGVFWDVRQSVTGVLIIEVDDGTAYLDLKSTVPINDGRPHDVVIARVAGELTIWTDGVATGHGSSKASLGALPPLRVGSDVCASTTAPFEGTVLMVACIKPNH